MSIVTLLNFHSFGNCERNYREYHDVNHLKAKIFQSRCAKLVCSSLDSEELASRQLFMSNLSYLILQIGLHVHRFNKSLEKSKQVNACYKNPTVANTS